MRASRRWKSGPRIEVLPLIDVVFLLLVAFMYSVVTMVRSTAIPVRLPRMETVQEVPLSAVLVVSVRADGVVVAGGEPIEASVLRAHVRSLREADPELAVLLNADGGARHARVARVLDALRAAGQERVFLAGVPDAPASD